jgi:hypothetical protein
MLRELPDYADSGDEAAEEYELTPQGRAIIAAIRSLSDSRALAASDDRLRDSSANGQGPQ